MFVKNWARKGWIALLVVMLVTQGLLPGWTGGNTAYAADDLTSKGISATIPLLNATQADGTQPLKIEFTNPVKKVNGTTEKIIIRRFSDNSVVRELNVSDQAVSITPDDLAVDPYLGKVVTITPSPALPGGSFYVSIGSGSFAYADNQPFTGLNKEWTFHVATASPARLLNRTPQTASTGVSPSANLTLTFDQAMSRGTGKLQIYQGNTLFEEVDANSSQISFNGSQTTVTIDPVRNWANNSTIYIAVPEGFFRDTLGNDTAAIQRIDWGFSVISDPSAITVASLSPANGATGIALNTELNVTFTKELDTSYSAQAILRSSNGGTVNATTIINSSNNRQLRIIPQSSLTSNTTYTVDIPGNVFRDRSGNLFTGLTGTTSWTFRTLSVDTTPPVLKTAKMYSNTIIRLTYDEWLSTFDPLPSSFAVTVNGENRSVSTAYVSGDSVHVVLDTGVAVGQVVRVAYTAPTTTTRRIQDLSLNAAASFSARDVENGLDSIMSKPREGMAYTNSIILYYPETVYINSSDAYKQFSVTADGKNIGVSSISTNTSSQVTLNLSSSISNGEVVRVSYQPGDQPVKDSRGQPLAGFSGFYVRNSNDSKPPVFQKAEVNTNKLWIYYNEPLSRLNKPMNNQYSVLADGKAIFVNNIDIDDDLVTLTLATPVTSTQVVTLSYVPGASRLTDLGNNQAALLDLVPVTQTFGNGTILSGILQGDTIQINFRNALKSEAALTPSQFRVQIGNEVIPASSASVNGSVVTIKISKAAQAGQSGTVTYTPGGVQLRDALNTEVGAFGPLTLQEKAATTTPTENTSVGLPAWLTERNANNSGFAQSMLILSTDAATAKMAASRYNRTTQQYTLDENKLEQAFNYASSSYKLNQPIIFEVPTTSEAAYVGIPFHKLSQLAGKYRAGTIGVKFKDNVWMVPLADLAFVSMGQSAGITTAPGTATMYVQMESVPRLSAGAMDFILSRSNAQSLGEATETFITIFNGNTGKSVEQNIKSQYLTKLPGNTSTLLTTLTAIDPTSQSLSYIPTAYRTSSTGIVARGLLDGNRVIAPITHLVSFSKAPNWSRDALTELASKWIITSDNLDKYNVKAQITRAEFAELVARGLGLKPDASSAQFTDLGRRPETNGYIGAAVKARIIQGVGNGKFQPNSPITREQMAIMLVNAMDYVGQLPALQEKAETTLKVFKDKDKIKASKDYVAKAVQTGIIQGNLDQTFKPLGKATREQAAVMLKRMLNQIGYL
ncbi:Ig-like domain-containing protein [Paenibacillus polysaccharolyticus]|uniref:SwmB domain-containing protein n=1 Tax=Paenibacillus polysaccharolyticus TaxID=582692 RepID=UPI00203E248E|nr:Ig-like domain-containing protein [Paenibacillus polysaccharolyticus]